MTSSVRNVNIDNVNRLVEAVRIGGVFDMAKIVRVTSDIGGYASRPSPQYKGSPHETERIVR